ncbi:unnamed protein product, partial [Iphiclides podalirius]
MGPMSGEDNLCVRRKRTIQWRQTPVGDCWIRAVVMRHADRGVFVSPCTEIVGKAENKNRPTWRQRASGANERRPARAL